MPDVAPRGVQKQLSEHADRMSPSAYWELLMNLTRREVKGRYSQSLFGIGWAVAQPLATMAVFMFVFARLANITSDVPYPLFAYAALVPWFFFSNSVASGTMSLITYRTIVTKTYFPREIVPLAQISSRLIDFLAAAGLYAGLMVYYRTGLGSWALMAPVFFGMLLLFTVGFTMATSAINVFYRDVNPVVQIALQLWLYLTPVGYSLAMVPPRYRPFFLLNPLTAIVEGFRSSIVYNRAPDWSLFAVALTITLAVFASAFVMFKRMDKYFADVI